MSKSTSGRSPKLQGWESLSRQRDVYKAENVVAQERFALGRGWGKQSCKVLEISSAHALQDSRNSEPKRVNEGNRDGEARLIGSIGSSQLDLFVKCLASASICLAMVLAKW